MQIIYKKFVFCVLDVNRTRVQRKECTRVQSTVLFSLRYVRVPRKEYTRVQSTCWESLLLKLGVYWFVHYQHE